MGAVFLATGFAEAIEADGARWLVGVSGGGDSVALLRLLVGAGLQDRVVVGYFNHKWGAFGDASESFVRGLARELGLEFRAGQGTGKAGANAEALARQGRYEWFRQVCTAEGLAGVLVAHTRDDVAESFLMRAGKGSGLGGLAGMRGEAIVLGVRVVRPLLGADRGQLRAYLRELGQAWLEDPDNEAGGSQRARLRKLMPQLEAAGVTMHGLAASSTALAEADEVMRAVAADFQLDVTRAEVRWERTGFTEAPAEVAVRVLARVMTSLLGEVMVVRRAKRMALWQRIRVEETGVATLGGVRFAWSGSGVVARAE